MKSLQLKMASPKTKTKFKSCWDNYFSSIFVHKCKFILKVLKFKQTKTQTLGAIFRCVWKVMNEVMSSHHNLL